MNMAYARFRSDNMSGTTNGKDLVSVKYKVSTVDTAIENGNIVAVGDYITGEREVRAAGTPAANTALNKLAILGSDEVVKDKKYHGIAAFRNEAGAISRGYRLRTGDLFAVTAEALNKANDYTVEVGTVVEAYAGTKLNCVASLTANSTQIGTVVLIETAGTTTWYVIEVA